MIVRNMPGSIRLSRWLWSVVLQKRREVQLRSYVTLFLQLCVL
jgi:hypothetical protein